MSWDDSDSDGGDFTSAAPVAQVAASNNWDDEDADDNVVEDWEVDSDEEREKAKKKKEEEKVAKKSLKQKIKEKEAAERARKAAILASLPKNKAEERAQQERMALSNVSDLFGGSSDEDVDDTANVVAKIKIEEPNLMDAPAPSTKSRVRAVPLTAEQALKKFEMKTVDDYKKLASLISAKIIGKGTKPQLKNSLEFFKELLTESTKKMDLEMVTKIKSNINLIYNKKTKERNNKKKKKSKRANPKLHAGSMYEDYSQYDY